MCSRLHHISRMTPLLFLLLLLATHVPTDAVPVDGDEVPQTLQQTEDDEVKSPVLNRQTRQTDGEPKADTMCDFGKDNNLKTCDWTNANFSGLEWKLGTGKTAQQVGGPEEDVSSKDGGYVFVATKMSQVTRNRQDNRYAGQKERKRPDRAYFLSPDLEPTEPRGRCIKFSYRIEGPSAKKIRILLEPLEGANTTSIVLWETNTKTEGEWMEIKRLYSFVFVHRIVLVGIPEDRESDLRSYVGYIAVDDLDLNNGDKCGHQCWFEGGKCGWQDKGDFSWEISRGTSNRLTGPPRDHLGFGGRDDIAGAYAYIDSRRPRQSGQAARLVSPDMEQKDPDLPLCMSFWTFMYGEGIGSLNIYVQEGNNERMVWSLQDNAGNNWYQGQVNVAPTKKNGKFKVVIEGVIGNPNTGDIAIDEIAFENKVCLTAPEVAATGDSDVSCTFERGLCTWTNVGRREGLDEGDWERIVAEDSGNNYFSVDKTFDSGDGFFLKTEMNRLNSPGSRAWLVSKEVKGTGEPVCLNFWYASNEPYPNARGPSLGSLTVYTKVHDQTDFDKVTLTPIWKVTNEDNMAWTQARAVIEDMKKDEDFRLVFEAEVGSNRAKGMIGLDDISLVHGECSLMPEYAKSLTIAGCNFAHDSCGWGNSTTNDNYRYMMASEGRYTSINLRDHTYDGRSGYVYFDVFNNNNRPVKVRMISPTIKKVENRGKAKLCFTFFFAELVPSEGTTLKILTRNADQENEEDPKEDQVWKVSPNFEEAFPSTSVWQFGRVPMEANKDFQVIIEGRSSSGGYAIDDIEIITDEDDDCKIKPEQTAKDDEN